MIYWIILHLNWTLNRKIFYITCSVYKYIDKLTTRFYVVHLLLLAVNCERFITKNRTSLNHWHPRYSVFQASRVLRASGEILPLRNVISITMINYERRLHESLTARRRTLSNSLLTEERVGRAVPQSCSIAQVSPTAAILEFAAGSDSYWPKNSRCPRLHYVN